MHSEKITHTRVIYPVYHVHFFRPEFSSFAFVASALASASACLLEREGLQVGRYLSLFSFLFPLLANDGQSCKIGSSLIRLACFL